MKMCARSLSLSFAIFCNLGLRICLLGVVIVLMLTGRGVLAGLAACVGGEDTDSDDPDGLPNAAAVLAMLPYARDGRSGGVQHMTLLARRRWKERNKTTARLQVDMQVEHHNNSGSARTVDFVIPRVSPAKCRVVRGRGTWKAWTPEAISKAGFASCDASGQSLVFGVEGASRSNATACRSALSQIILDGIHRGEQRFMQAKWDFHIHVVMFDESKLKILYDRRVKKRAVLAFHAQVVCSSGDCWIEWDQPRPPRALHKQNTATMWSDLSLVLVPEQKPPADLYGTIT
jgi:hypothetical protein